jgi:hypothetical protein
VPDPIRAFWIDWDYDRNNADTGTRSRYSNYLRQSPSFGEIWYDDPSVEFAAIAWRIATGPIMSPPLVHSHPRIMGAAVQRSDWNGEMIADIRLVSRRPQALFNAKTVGGTYYRDCQLDPWGSYAGIGEEDLTRNAYLTAELRMLWQLPAGTLSTLTAVPTDHAALFDQAVECVETLVRALNREVAPVIEQLER